MEWLLLIGGLIALVAHHRGKKRSSKKSSTSKPEKKESTTRTSNVYSSSPQFEHHASDRNKKAAAPARWVAPGETIKIGSVKVDTGMFYLGGALPGQHDGRSGNCVIDPSRKVASSAGDPSGSSMSYWPSYQQMSPAARRTYLEWIARGRQDPDISVGYVFLAFYGLEHRLFVDKAFGEAPALLAEVKRLLQVYGDHHSFRNHATTFLEAAALVLSTELPRPELSPDLRNGYEMPMTVRAYLGQKLSSREPLDSDDALLWVLSLPDTSLRTPATRCFEELVPLWRHRYRARHPNGLKVTTPKKRLKLEYRAASGGFTGQIDVSDGNGPLPDITAISAPLAGLRDLLSACTDDLAPYSRLLGKKPEAKGTLEAALLLPREIDDATARTEAGNKIDELFAGRGV
ncbi:MAG TPA: TerB N-terminal domain-containing protein, partial [Pseudorhizobium sp.]|nr:TerB N-terminal domain-containing protein [Pseudorhizobium sp.]